ncbi:hypothetical protein ABUW04_35620 [Streptacidiphilus sp. N1-10]|uniref:AAA+ ATPase domain-containing protein n=1 Tax=Streptacidiphilus jeojiensis TaxID=3229225 RepID=A0ABV6XZ89_9ACTN
MSYSKSHLDRLYKGTAPPPSRRFVKIFLEITSRAAALHPEHHQELSRKAEALLADAYRERRPRSAASSQAPVVSPTDSTVTVLRAQLDLERALRTEDRLRWALSDAELMMTTLLQIISALREIITDLDNRQGRTLFPAHATAEDQYLQAYSYRQTTESQLDRVNDRRRYLEALWEQARADVLRFSKHPDVTAPSALPPGPALPPQQSLPANLLAQPALTDIAAALGRAEQIIAADEHAIHNLELPAAPNVPLRPEDELAILLSATRLSDANSRAMALTTLLKTWPCHPGARGALVHLAGDSDAKIRTTVAQGLIRDESGNGTVRDALIRLAHDTDSAVQATAVQGLASAWPRDIVARDALITLLSQHHSDGTRRCSIEALAEGWPEDLIARDALSALTRDTEFRVRETVVKSLSATWPTDRVARDALVGLIHDRDLSVRELVPEAIAAGRQGDPIVADALRTLLSDPNPTVRWAVERALALWDESDAGPMAASIRAHVASPAALSGQGFLAAARVPREFDPGTSLPLLGTLRRGIALDAGITLLIGPNGYGKTIMLNALWLRTNASHTEALPGMSPLSSEVAVKLELLRTNRVPEQVVYEDAHYRRRRAGALRGQTEGSPNCLFLIDTPFSHYSPAETHSWFEEMQELTEEGCQFVVTATEITQPLPPAVRSIRIAAGTDLA